MSLTDHDFEAMIDRAVRAMKNAPIVHTERWQSVDISSKPEMATHEVRHFFMDVPIASESLDSLRAQIKPNMPWADDHFEERVCGQPINPGVQWAKWPYAHSASTFLRDGKFNHNYMERYWPKHAGARTPTETPDQYARIDDRERRDNPIFGIYHPYGDLNDVVAQLEREPHTRQAILPVFFPEDTGAMHGGRVPCSLFYQFMMRNGRLDVSYMLRSCDIVRHFRDDIYLTVRLLLWMLDRLRERNKQWRLVRPGHFVMLITSLHCFVNDHKALFHDHR